MQRTTKCYDMKMRYRTIFDTPGQWSVGDHARHVAAPLPLHLFLLSFPIKVVVVRRYWKELNAQISCPLFSSMCEYKDSGKSERWYNRKERKEKEREKQWKPKTYRKLSTVASSPKPSWHSNAQQVQGKRKAALQGVEGGGAHALCALFDNWQKQLLCVLLLLLLPKKFCVFFAKKQ